VNAACALIAALPPPTRRRLAGGRHDAAAEDAALAARFAGDLVALLNCLRADELRGLCAARRLGDGGDAGALRARLWRWGALAEAGGAALLGTPVQPIPVAARRAPGPRRAARGLAPPGPAWPRPIPPAAAAGPARRRARPTSICSWPPPIARSACGCRRAVATRARGAARRRRSSASSSAAPTSPTGAARSSSRPCRWPAIAPVRWRVTEDPAVGDGGRVALGQARPACCGCAGRPVDDGATLVSWYLLDWDADLARWIRRDLHTRPKGPRGTAARGWYLHKRFFVDAGLYATLNGPPVTP
jgi:hypothetical protein